MAATTPIIETVSGKTQRVLACVLCQQRKVKCDRKVPCGNCVKADSQCVPAALLPRQRRRRFPERDLLERLRRYESLLREHNIEFQPLHPMAADKSLALDGDQNYSSAGHESSQVLVEKSSESFKQDPGTTFDTVNLWNALNEQPRESDDGFNKDDSDSDLSHAEMHEDTIKKAWKNYRRHNDHFLFGTLQAGLDLSTLHPEHSQMFKLWQTYLDNVDPLLKVTHTPTLQPRIINAANDMANLRPTLEALMFSIYCISVLSLVDEECLDLFGASRKELLAKYQFACQQSLLRCGVQRTDDLECLTALYFYLMSVKPDIEAFSLCSMLGVAIRIAQHMGIHKESSNAKHTVLEAELRRRLWWSLILFDHRTCEMSSNLSATTLIPTWDCKTPSNLNDFELRLDTKKPPATHDQPTEALFTIVRSELNDMIRHSGFHLDFVNPSLRGRDKYTRHGPIPKSEEPRALEKEVEEKFLQKCNPEIPLHFMTIWTTRSHLAKNRLLEHYSKYAKPGMQLTDGQRDSAIFHALRILECETKLSTSPLTKGYLWHIQSYFFFLAYIHIVHDLQRRPIQEHADTAWEIMSEDAKTRFTDVDGDSNPFFKVFSRSVLRAWEAREAASRHLGQLIEPPMIVTEFKRKTTRTTPNAPESNSQYPDDAMDMSMDDFPMLMPMGFGGQGLSYSFSPQIDSASWEQSDLLVQPTMNLDSDQLEWNTIDPNLTSGRSW